MNVSAHPALIVQSQVEFPSATSRTGWVRDGPIGPANEPLAADGDGLVCTCGVPSTPNSVPGNGDLYRLDKSNGASLQLIGNTGISAMMDISFDSSDALWGTVNGFLYTFDTNTAAVTSTTAITGVPAGAGSIMGLMFDQTDILFATAHVDNSPLFTINTSTGAATIVGYPGLNGPHGGDIYIEGAPPVPEPASFALLGLGALGLMVGVSCGLTVRTKPRLVPRYLRQAAE